jgi:hypothetical protein
LNLAAWTGFFQPLPAISFTIWLSLAAAATLAIGLIAGRWASVALAIVPPLVASIGDPARGDVGVVVPYFAAALAAALLICGIASSRLLHPRVAVVSGALLLVPLLAVVGWATARTIWPHDAQPAHPLRVGQRAGSFQGVSLGQSLADAKHAMPRSVQSTAPQVRPLDSPSAPIGVSYMSANARSVLGDGIAVLAEHGTVVTLFITNPSAETIAGIGIGDNLALARARLSGLTCRQSNEDAPTCGGRFNHHIILFVGDPIETITLSTADTGWCLIRSDSCHRRTPTPPIRIR